MHPVIIEYIIIIIIIIICVVISSFTAQQTLAYSCPMANFTIFKNILQNESNAAVQHCDIIEMLFYSFKATFTLVRFSLKMRNFCYGYASRLHSVFSSLGKKTFENPADPALVCKLWGMPKQRL